MLEVVISCNCFSCLVSYYNNISIPMIMRGFTFLSSIIICSYSSSKFTSVENDVYFKFEKKTCKVVLKKEKYKLHHNLINLFILAEVILFNGIILLVSCWICLMYTIIRYIWKLWGRPFRRTQDRLWRIRYWLKCPSNISTTLFIDGLSDGFCWMQHKLIKIIFITISFSSTMLAKHHAWILPRLRFL